MFSPTVTTVIDLHTPCTYYYFYFFYFYIDYESVLWKDLKTTYLQVVDYIRMLSHSCRVTKVDVREGCLNVDSESRKEDEGRTKLARVW